MHPSSLGYLLSLTLVTASVLISSALGADAQSNQPYLDQIKSRLEKEDSTHSDVNDDESYTEIQKKKLESNQANQDHSSEGYTKRLQEKLRVEDQKKRNPDPTESYSETEKTKLPPQEEGGAIRAVQEGKSELHAKKKGNISRAFGFRYGASLSRDISAPGDVQKRSFNDVYGSNYAPDLSFFYEYQPLHSEWYGNVGLRGVLGLSYFHGPGLFGFNIQKPGTGNGSFPLQSKTNFKFFEIPVTLALNYRFNLVRYIRPYVMAGPTAIGYVEMRDDPKKGNRGYSGGILFSVGAAFLLDWISPSNSWDLYEGHGIKQYYLTVDYTRLSTLWGDVKFGINGVVAGLTFEY